MNRLPALDSLRAVGALAVVGSPRRFRDRRDNGTTRSGAAGSPGSTPVSRSSSCSPDSCCSGHTRTRSPPGVPVPSPRRYLWRRALRILPAYWLMVVVCLTVLPQNRPAPIGDWVRHLTLHPDLPAGPAPCRASARPGASPPRSLFYAAAAAAGLVGRSAGAGSHARARGDRRRRGPDYRRLGRSDGARRALHRAAHHVAAVLRALVRRRAWSWRRPCRAAHRRRAAGWRGARRPGRRAAGLLGDRPRRSSRWPPRRSPAPATWPSPPPPSSAPSWCSTRSSRC